MIIFCLLVSLLSPGLAAGLTVSELMNGKYFIPPWENEDQGEWVQLRDGEYDRKDHDKVLYVKIVATALGRLSPAGDRTPRLSTAMVPAGADFLFC